MKIGRVMCLGSSWLLICWFVSGFLMRMCFVCGGVFMFFLFLFDMFGDIMFWSGIFM